MKKTRLLEIIREEIADALNEIPAVAKDSDLLKEIEQFYNTEITDLPADFSN